MCLVVFPINDPLLQTLMEQDRILSRSKQGPASSNNQEKAKDLSSELSTEIIDNFSESSLDKGKPFESSVVESSPSNRDSGSASLPPNIMPIDEKEIVKNRLSLEQIKEIPKFANYHPGGPNKVSDDDPITRITLVPIKGGFRLLRFLFSEGKFTFLLIEFLSLYEI